MPSLESQAREEILQSGPISFARFMSLALYCPVLSYYETHDRTIGRSGDFFTSVSVGEVFGQILGCRFAAWLKSIQPGETHLVECGAHDGRLAHDVLAWLRKHEPALFASLTYWIVEPSPVREQRQQNQLAEYAPRVRWVSALQNLPRVRGVLFSNELLDAFPVHVIRWHSDSGRWRERGVDWNLIENRFVWVDLPEPRIHIETELARAGLLIPSELAEVLPDGFTVEVCPEALDWWGAAAGTLDRGWMIACDYGLTSAELLRPERTRGTLRAYRDHRVSEDVLAEPGTQDLTAHVNFSAVASSGEARGLVTEALARQGECLARWVTEALSRGVFADWTPAQRRQFQTLVHPSHLGHTFRILVQSRGVVE